MIRLGLLVSGNLGYNVLKYLNEYYPIQVVFTDKNSEGIIDYCTREKIGLFIGNPRANRSSSFIENTVIDVLISINYLFIIEKELISLPKKLAFNIHGSLLPKYRGRTPHVWAIINNEQETGVTAHKIDEGCDTGDIIDQIVLPINSNDTGSDILNKFNELYIPLIENVLEKVKDASIILTKQDSFKATYFGKRTPDDGRINWNWQKERIRNWVRAQASPYPGAFTFFNEQKIIIDEITYENLSFSWDMPNGLILLTNPILVKTPNGVVKLNKVRTTEISVEVNQILK